jgi:hypothetical protein
MPLIFRTGLSYVEERLISGFVPRRSPPERVETGADPTAEAIDVVIPRFLVADRVLPRGLRAGWHISLRASAASMEGFPMHGHSRVSDANVSLALGTK